MGIRSAIRSLITRQPVGTYSATKPDDAYGLLSRIFPARMGEPPALGELDMLRAYTKYPWLRAVVHRVCYAVATTDWQLFVVSKGGKAQPAKHIQRALQPATRATYLKAAADAGELKQITDHPLLTLLSQPNPVLTGIETLLFAQEQLEMVGNSFFVKERNGAGMPVQLWPIPSYWISRTPTVDNPVYAVSFRGWQGEIPDTEVLWLKDPNPENPYARGRGIAQALADDIELDGYAAKHMRAWFWNGARPEMVISAPGLGEPETKRLENAWNNQNQGFWRAFKTMFINRELKVQPISQTFADQQMIELRTHERDVIRQVFGVPPEELGIVENSNRSTIGAADFMMARNVTVPRLERNRAFWQQFLVPEFDERLILDYVSPIKEDADFKLRSMSAQPGAFLIDEWRAMASHGPLERGEGATLFVPALVTPMDPSELSNAPTPTQAPTQPNDGKAAQIAAFGQRARVARPKAPSGLNAGRKLDKDGKHHPLVRVVDRLTGSTTKAATALLLAARQGVDEEALRTALKSGDTQAAVAATGIDGIEQRLTGLTGTMTRAAIAGAAAGCELLPAGVELEPEQAAPAARATVSKRKRKVLPLMAETSQRAVRQTVTAVHGEQDTERAARHIARVVGLTAPQAASLTTAYQAGEVDTKLDSDAAAQRQQRADAIGGNETHHAVHAGAVAAWATAQAQTGQKLTKTWETLDDERTCEDCIGLDGETVPVDEPFSNGEDNPPDHSLCRCGISCQPS
jgi:HK97 family phage portal protein